jgi:hypothetical protein
MTVLIRRHFDIQVTEANKEYSETFTLDKNIIRITGILFTSSIDGLAYQRGSQRLEINGREILPDGHETKINMTGINVPCDLKYRSVDIPAGNGRIKLEYKDEDNGVAVFAAYRLRLNIEAEMEDDF